MRLRMCLFRRFLYTGDVYRRDAVDACHYFCFHQAIHLSQSKHHEAMPLLLFAFTGESQPKQPCSYGP